MLPNKIGRLLSRKRPQDLGNTNAVQSASPSLGRSSTSLKVFTRKRALPPNPTQQIVESQSVELRAPPPVLTFVNSLKAYQVSNLLVWILYHDFVKLPPPVSQWYSPIPLMEMQGWIALGRFLASNDTYGFDLVVLDSICDRLNLSKLHVHLLLIRLSNREKMATSLLDTIQSEARWNDRAELEALKLVQSVLRDLKKLARSLKPTPGSEFDSWRVEIVERLSCFVAVIVEPRIAYLSGTDPSLEEWSTDEQIMIRSLWDVMQLDRLVPHEYYIVTPERAPAMALALPSSSYRGSSSLSQSILKLEAQVKEFLTVPSLQEENSSLRSRLASLEQENQQLMAENHKLSSNATVLGKEPAPMLSTPKRSRTISSPVDASPLSPISPDDSGDRPPHSHKRLPRSVGRMNLLDTGGAEERPRPNVVSRKTG